MTCSGKYEKDVLRGDIPVEHLPARFYFTGTDAEKSSPFAWNNGEISELVHNKEGLELIALAQANLRCSHRLQQLV